jgi:hypothetical protein
VLEEVPIGVEAVERDVGRAELAGARQPATLFGNLERSPIHGLAVAYALFHEDPESQAKPRDHPSTEAALSRRTI